MSRSRRPSSASSCQRCLREDAFVVASAGTLVPAQWFNCAVRTCKGKAHNDCVGFPNVNQEQIPFPWYCLVHLGHGRAPLNDNPDAVTGDEQEEVDEPGQEAAAASVPAAPAPTASTRSSVRLNLSRQRASFQPTAQQAPAPATAPATAPKRGRPKGSKNTRGGAK